MAIDHRIFSRLFSILIILILALTLNAKQIQIATATVDIFGSQSLEPDSIESQVIRCIIPLCTGTNKDDIIIGSFLNETIFGLKGDDNIQGNDGDDIIYGGDGNDVIQGGGGFDKLFGGNGNDVIIGDAEINLVGPQIFDEILINNRTNELLLGNNATVSDSIGQLQNKNINGTDVFASQAADDLLNRPISLLDGGKGDDTLIGTSGNEFYIGGPGHDYFDCNEGIDTVLDFNPNEDTANVNCENLK